MAFYGHDIRLDKLRNGIPVKAVIADMNRAGYAIKLSQFYRLLNGRWPSGQQVSMICEYFEVSPEWFLFGIQDGLLDNLSKSDKKLAKKFIKRLHKKNRLPPSIDELIRFAEDTLTLLSDEGGGVGKI